MPSKKKEPTIDSPDGTMFIEDGGDGIAQGLIEGITSMLQNPEDAGPDGNGPAADEGMDGEIPQADKDGDAPTPAKKKPAAKKPAAKSKAKTNEAPLSDPAPDNDASLDAEPQTGAEGLSADAAPADDDSGTSQTSFGIQVPEAEPDSAEVAATANDALAAESGGASPAPKTPRRRQAQPSRDPKQTKADAPVRRAPRKKSPDLNVLKIDAYSDIETPEDKEDLIWHEIHNAYRTRKILTGLLGGVEKAENGVCRAVIEYKGFRIMITMDEMMILLPGNTSRHAEPPGLRKEKRLNTMINAQVDFVVRGIDSKSRSVIASRKDAMMKKRQVFYMNVDHDGSARVHEGRVVQARVIGVFEKVVRVEVFGVESAIIARDLSWEWIGDARQHFSVGDTILVRVNEVRADSVEDISIAVDARSIRSQDGSENLKKCRVQGKYAGTVTDVRRGTVLVRLSIGVNAIAHSCFDNRVPGKKDDVSFVVTHIEEEKGVAMGIITRIIRQNL